MSNTWASVEAFQQPAEKNPKTVDELRGAPPPPPVLGICVSRDLPVVQEGSCRINWTQPHRGVGNVGMFRAFCRPLRGLIRVGDKSPGSRPGLTSVAPPALRGPFAPLA
jgi:hypothetical protein